MGKYTSPEITTGTYVRARLVVEYSANASSNNNSCKAYVQMWRTNTGYTSSGSGTIYIKTEDDSGWWTSGVTDSQKVTYNSYTLMGSARSLTINNDKTGRRTIKFYVKATNNVTDNLAFSEQVFSVTLDPCPVYALSISAGTGSSVSVERTSGVGSKGVLSAGTKKLYYGDKLKITFTPSSNYSITTNTVNDKAFTSGGTHTVSADVAVKAAATPLKSSVAATDANIESTSSIIITRYNNSYTHTLTYKFGSLTGTIVEKTAETAIPFPIPKEFYAQIPDDPDGICTITCETYNGGTSLGTTSCNMTVTAAKKLCAPVVTIEAVDSNPETVALTGNNKKIIRFHSDISVKATVEEQNGAYIKSTTIACGGAIANGKENTFLDAESVAVSATAIDSRDYPTTVEAIGLELIEYERLTVNATAFRPGPTSTTVNITAKGRYYNGSFGAVNNTLQLAAQFKPKSKEEYDETDAWTELTVTINDDNTYTAEGSLIGVDYKQIYDISVRAQDAIHKPEGPLADAVYHNLTVYKGTPIFDWGENDFSFNVPVSIEGQPINDFIIEQGVSGDWIFEKWASGISKCYGRITKDPNATIYNSTAGKADVAYVSLSNSFPEGLFKSKPFVFVTAIDSGIGNVTAEDSGSTSTICNVIVWGTDTAIGAVNVMAVGSWK